MIIFLIGVLILCLGIIYHLCTKKYLNPYDLEFIFAKKGQGKSTLLTKRAINYSRRGWTVFSNEPIPGTYLFNPRDIGKVQFPPHSVIILDEVSLLWNNRDFSKFPPEVRQWFKLQRHYKCKVIMCSQAFDVDKQIRDLADSLWLLEKKFRVFSYGKRINRRLTILEANGQSESRITDNLTFDSLFWFWCGSRSLTFIPAWTKYFNSFEAPRLDDKDFEFIPPLEDQDPRHISDSIALYLALVRVQWEQLLDKIRRKKD